MTFQISKRAMYAPYQIYSMNIDTICTRASIDDGMSKGEYRYFQVSEHNTVGIQ